MERFPCRPSILLLTAGPSPPAAPVSPPGVLWVGDPGASPPQESREVIAGGALQCPHWDAAGAACSTAAGLAASALAGASVQRHSSLAARSACQPGPGVRL